MSLGARKAEDCQCKQDVPSFKAAASYKKEERCDVRRGTKHDCLFSQLCNFPHEEEYCPVT